MLCPVSSSTHRLLWRSPAQSCKGNARLASPTFPAPSSSTRPTQGLAHPWYWSVEDARPCRRDPLPGRSQTKGRACQGLEGCEVRPAVHPADPPALTDGGSGKLPEQMLLDTAPVSWQNGQWHSRGPWSPQLARVGGLICQRSALRISPGPRRQLEPRAGFPGAYLPGSALGGAQRTLLLPR